MIAGSGFIILVLLYGNMACEKDCLTIGIITDGTGVAKKETLQRHGKTVVMMTHLIDTTEPFDILRSVRSLDSDKDIDVIVLVDYSISIPPQLLQAQNKPLIQLGPKSTSYQTIHNTEKANGPVTCNTRDDLPGSEEPKGIYCISYWNMTDIQHDSGLITRQNPRAVRSVIKTLRWRHIVVFYERLTEKETSQLVDELSKDGVLHMMFNVDEVRDLHEVLQELYKSNFEVKKSIEVVTVCRFDNTRKLLKVANEFDALNNNKTLLKKFSKWLVTFYGYSPIFENVLRDCANELYNVALLAIPEQKKVDFEVFYNGVNCILLDIMKEETANGSQADVKTNVIDKLQVWNPTAMCRAYLIDTLLWTEKGREFSTVGKAIINGNVVLNSDIFPNVKYGYNHRRFLVSTLPYKPFVIKRKVNNSTIYEGFCIDLLKELAHRLNFTYDLVEPDDGKWGSLTNKENITFNGLVGQLQRKEVDIVAAPISRQAERESVMDSSYPYFYAYTTVLVKKPDENASKWKTLINPFKWEVLVTIGASLVTVTILAFLLEKYNPFYDVPVHAQNRLKKGGLHTWHSSFWYIFGALLCQGGVHLPESNAGRTLISCWWLTCIIIVGTYCGNLIAFLTVTKERPQFNTLQEMLNLKGTYKWGTLGGTFWEMTIPSSSNPTYKAVGEAFLEFNKSDPTILHRNPAYHVNRVKEEKYAWIGDKTYIEISMAKECSLMKIKEEFMLLRYVFGFINNSPHTAAFSEQMMKIHEGGLFQIWKRKWWPQSNFCAGNTIPEAKPISLLDVQSAFYVCLIGIVLGVLTFFIEIILHKYWICKQNERKGSDYRANSDEILKSTQHKKQLGKGLDETADATITSI